MEKSLLFFTLSVACLWVVLDEFYGEKRLSKILENLTPDIQTPMENFIHGTATLEDKLSDQQKAHEIIDNSKVNDKAKDTQKEIVDKFYRDMGVGST